MPVEKRTYTCECGYHEDRDIHAAKNMLAIKDLAIADNCVPPGQREVTLTDWNNVVLGRSEKISPFKG